MNKILFSSKSDNWRTPQLLYNYFIFNNYKDLFKFNSSYNEFDCIYKNDKLFINPPYSIINKKFFKDWLDQLIFKFENDIYLLIPSRTDTKLFSHLFNISNEIYFFKGRLHFNELKCVAPFPSVLFHINLIIKKREIFNLSIDQFISFDCLHL